MAYLAHAGRASAQLQPRLAGPTGRAARRPAVQLQPSGLARLARPAPRRGCSAAAEGEGSGTKPDVAPQVPAAGPARGNAEPSAEPNRLQASADASASSGSGDERLLSVEEIQALAAQRRAAAKEAGLVEGVLEEVRLIRWPSPGQAVLQTLLVVAMVAGTSLLLFGVNTVLAELSRRVYH